MVAGAAHWLLIEVKSNDVGKWGELVVQIDECNRLAHLASLTHATRRRRI
jgi:hypothetical protein